MPELERDPRSRQRRRVVITGMGVCTAMACGVEEFFSALVRGHSGVSEIVGMPIAREKRLAAQIKEVPLELPLRSTRFAREAIEQVLAHARISARDAEIGLFLATVCGDGHDLERRYRDFMAADGPVDEALRGAILAFPLHSVADRLANELELRGLRDVNTNACASGNIAIGRALFGIRRGLLDVAVVCGTEQFRPIGYWGADRAGILGSALRPFHLHRDGTVLGEGAAALVIEELGHAESRGATILAELTGYGISCSDNPHEIIPPMNGAGVARCIFAALRDAGVTAADVDYVNAHATGTVNIEIAECRGLRTAFGDRAREIPVNATKSYSGHLSAASAILEMIATVLAIKRRFIHPNLGLDMPDESLEVCLVGEQGLEVSPRCAVSMAMGAGGVNTAVVVEPPSRRNDATASTARAPEPSEIWITGVGPVTSLGIGNDEFFSRLLRIRDTPPPYSPLWGIRSSGLVAAEAMRRQITNFERYEIYNRAAQLGLVAVVLAVRDAALDAGLVTSQRLGLIVGTHLGGTGTWTDLMCEAYERNPRHITPSVSLPHGAHLCATLVSRELGVVGPTVTLTSGATAGLSGVAYAAELLRANELDAVIVCGMDILDRMTARAHRLIACPPPQGGALLGEGAAAFVLERAGSVIERGGRPLARMAAAKEAFGRAPADRFDRDALIKAMLQARGAHAGHLAVLSCASGLAGFDLSQMMKQPAAAPASADTIVTQLHTVLGEAGAAGPMLSLALAVGSVQRRLMPVVAALAAPSAEETAFIAEPPHALPPSTRLLVPAINPGGAAACVACEPVQV